MRIGVFGGTFDPPHTGHLIVAQDAAELLALDRVLFLPAAVPPHKPAGRVTEGGVRLAMLESALEGAATFRSERLELDRAGPSFTVDTLRILRATQPDAELFLLLGADQYAEFHTWREPAGIVACARLAVLERDGAVRRAPAAGGFPAQHVPVTRIDISATAIRARVAAGRPIRYLVPAAVETYIQRHGLYRNGAALPG